MQIGGGFCQDHQDRRQNEHMQVVDTDTLVFVSVSVIHGTQRPPACPLSVNEENAPRSTSYIHIHINAGQKSSNYWLAMAR